MGYGVAVIGLCILAVGGPSDLAWHTKYGFEVNVDAIYTPAAPDALLRRPAGVHDRHPLASGRSPVTTPDLRALRARAASSAILFIGVAGFITMYLSAFMTDVTPTSAFMDDLKRFHDVRADQSISLNAGLTGYGDDQAGRTTSTARATAWRR